MKKAVFRVLTLLVLILPVYLTFFANHNPVKGVPVTSLKDQLSSAQLSFFARLASYSSSIARIDTTANPSETTANLAAGDTLSIANSGVTTVTVFTVKDIGDTASIELSAAIGTTTPNAYIVATRSAIHTINFTPQVSSVGESWLFLIKVTDRTGELFNDGIPDQTGFDIGADVGGTTIGSGTRIKTADVTCPFGGTPSAIGSTTVITSGVSTGFTGAYAIVSCSGNGTVGVGGSMIIGRALASGSQIINPSPGLNHTAGQANATSDTLTYALRQLDNLGAIIDTTFGKLAVTESVRITAIVDPTITFIIDNVGTTNVGASRCGSALGNGALRTTATSVSFGPLVLGTFNNLAQRLQCTTNAQNGYVIQAYENRNMTMLGATTTIPDTNCDGGGCTPTAQRAWTTYTNSGFGYSLEVGTTTAGGTVSIGITTAGHYKPFGNGYTNAQPILSRTATPTGTDSIYVCYRTTASTLQPAGTYENMVNYIATATF